MRCLSIADLWCRQGGSVAFLSCRADPKLRRKYQAVGCHFIEVRERHPAGDDLYDTVEAIAQTLRENGQVPWVALDGYHFDAAYHSALRAAGCRLMVIDDGGQLPYYDADIIVNHGAHAPELDYRCAPQSLLLLGTRFALLRREFQHQAENQKPLARSIKKILVTMGGSDPANVGAKVMQALTQLNLEDFTARIIVGPVNPHGKRLRAIASASPWPMILEAGPRRMAPLMRWADLAITAAGGTCWELAAMGVPMMTLTVADNQRPIARALEANGASVDLGWHEEVSAERIVATIAELTDDLARRARMSENGRGLVDGQGVERVVKAMREKFRLQAAETGGIGAVPTPADGMIPTFEPVTDARLRLRAAKKDDAYCLWQWANDSVTRGNSFEPAPIPWPAHKQWYEEHMASLDCRIWILELDRVPAGQIRYDRTDPGTALISFSVAPSYRRRSLGTKLLCMSVELAGQELGVKRVRGYTFEENLGSIKAFVNAGFALVGRETVAGHLCSVFQKECLNEPIRESRAAIH